MRLHYKEGRPRIQSPWPFYLTDCAGNANFWFCFLALNVCVSEGFDADNDGVGDGDDSDEFSKHLMYSLAL